MTIEAMKQALEALEFEAEGWECVPPITREAIAVLRAAIDQAQEPVAHTLNCVCGAVWDVSPDGVEEMVHAPTPSSRQWQGLTDEEIDELALDENGLPNSHIEFARAIEAKLKEKNA